MERQRITIAFGVALALHAGALWWWAELPTEVTGERTVKLELLLTQISLSEKIKQPEKINQPDSKIEDTVDSQAQPKPEPQAVSEPELASLPESVTNDAHPSVEAETAVETGLPRLDLTRPDNWADEAPLPGTIEDYARTFRGDFYQRLEQRQTAKARSRLHTGRHTARFGLAANDYNAMERPGSGHYKTTAGCFDLKPDIVGTIGGAQRAWIAACKDLIKTPFELPRVEFDALGRAMAPLGRRVQRPGSNPGQ